MTVAGRLRWRRTVNAVMLGGTGVCAVAIAALLLFILGYLFLNGANSLTWSFFTELPSPVGETGGGMANAIVGSAKVLGIAVVVGVPVGFLAGVYLAEYAGGTAAFIVRYVTDLLNGVPSIVIGIFAYSLVVLKTRHFSALAGGVALGIMMIPIAVRSTEEFLRAVPRGLREAALALGAPKWRVLATVVVPAARDGIVTGILLNLARVAGETAPLLFTAFGNRFWSSGIDQPTATLPVMIYSYAIAPYEDWHRQAWAGGFVLLLLVLLINIIARVVLARSGLKAAR
jgi:phosphate transport system permease protein